MLKFITFSIISFILGFFAKVITELKTKITNLKKQFKMRNKNSFTLLNS